MSEENRKIARRMCEAAWRRPQPDYETIMELGHPMFTIQSLVEGGGYTGAGGFQDWLASWAEMFGENWVSTVEDVEDVEDERVLVSGWMEARGSRGGVPIQQRFWVVMWIHDGRAIRSEVHTVRAEALEAAGLSE